MEDLVKLLHGLLGLILLSMIRIVTVKRNGQVDPSCDLIDAKHFFVSHALQYESWNEDPEKWKQSMLIILVSLEW